MDYARIEKLLEKYWDCTSTREEEEELRRFFTESSLPAHLLPWKAVFEYQQEEREEGLDDTFDCRILDKIAGRREKKMGRWKFYLRIAAMIVIMFGAGMLILQSKTRVNPWDTDTYESPEQALAEVRKTLCFVSGKMNQGQKIIEANVEKMETITRYIK